MFMNYNGSKPEVSNRNIPRILQNIWKIYHIHLNNLYIKQEEFENIFNRIKRKHTYQICEVQPQQCLGEIIA